MGSPQPVSLALPILAPSPLYFSPAQELLRKGLSSVTQERQTNDSPRCWTLTRTTCLLWPATPQAGAGAPTCPAARVLLLGCFPQNFSPRRGFVTNGHQDGWWLYSEPWKLIPCSSRSQTGMPGGQPPVLHATVLSTRLVPSPGPCSLHTGRSRSPGLHLAGRRAVQGRVCGTCTRVLWAAPHRGARGGRGCRLTVRPKESERPVPTATLEGPCPHPGEQCERLPGATHRRKPAMTSVPCLWLLSVREGCQAAAGV